MKNGKKLITVAAMAFLFAAPCYAERIVVEGSTTVLPLAQRAAEEFMKENSSADIVVRGGGSGVGIASLIDGTCDVADASRSMKDTELDKAVANGRNPKAHVVAMDGIAILVHPTNPVNGLTKQQVKDIFTGKISDWSQVGGNAGKIVVISRDTSSGTYEAFSELAMDKQKPRADALLQASNQAVASTVARTPGAIGYAGLAFISESAKSVTVNGVEATKANVLSKKYPYGRPLFMYTDGSPEGLTKEFIEFVKSQKGQAIADEEGYVGLR